MDIVDYYGERKADILTALQLRFLTVTGDGGVLICGNTRRVMRSASGPRIGSMFDVVSRSNLPGNFI